MLKNFKCGFLVLLLVFVGLIFVGVSRNAYCAVTQDVTFAWEPNTEADLAGYRLYRSSESGKYIFGKTNALLEIPKGTHKATVKTVEPGFFVLTAFDKNDFESGPSVELETFPPITPKSFNITIVIKIET